MTDKALLGVLDGLEWHLTLNHMKTEESAICQIKRMLTPAKVIGRHTNCKCPACGRRVRSGNGSSSRVRDKRCQDCGQVIDWTEFDKREHTWRKSEENKQ